MERDAGRITVVPCVDEVRGLGSRHVSFDVARS